MKRQLRKPTSRPIKSNQLYYYSKNKRMIQVAKRTEQQS